jgi:GT2 family glycosyltransferase
MDFLYRSWITTFSCTLIRRSAFDKVGLLDERREVMCCDDYDLWLRIAETSKILFGSDDFVYYRMHAGNLIKNYDQYLAAHLFVLGKALANSASLTGVPKSEIRATIQKNLYRKYRYFAFIHYYKTGDIKKARHLFWRAISLKPYMLNNAPYLLICCLPANLRVFLKKIKQRLLSVGI